MVHVAAALAGDLSSPDGLPSDNGLDPAGMSGSPDDGFGGLGALIVLVVVAAVVILVVKVLLARRMARDSGMSTGQATAMTLLSDDGLDATYLAANIRPRPAPPAAPPSAPPSAPPAAPWAAPPASAESRLVELQSLLDRGLVTREEYAARRKAIVDSL